MNPRIPILEAHIEALTEYLSKNAEEINALARRGRDAAHEWNRLKEEREAIRCREEILNIKHPEKS